VDDALQNTGRLALQHATQSENSAARESARELEREQWRKIETERERDRADFEAQRRIGMCKRVVARMLKQQLALSWSSFVKCVAERKHNREAIRLVLSKMSHRLAQMTHRTLTRAFSCYAGAVETVLAQREWVARTMARRKTSGLKRAMEVWTEKADMVRSERAREAQELARQYMQDILNKQQEKVDVARDMERAAELERERERQRERAVSLSLSSDRERELRHVAGLREELKEKGKQLKEKENQLKGKEEQLQLARAEEERQRTLLWEMQQAKEKQGEKARARETSGLLHSAQVKNMQTQLQMSQTEICDLKTVLERERFIARATTESQRARDERGIVYISRLVLRLDSCRRLLWNLRVMYSWKGQATGVHVARLKERQEDLVLYPTMHMPTHRYSLNTHSHIGTHAIHTHSSDMHTHSAEYYCRCPRPFGFGVEKVSPSSQGPSLTKCSRASLSTKVLSCCVFVCVRVRARVTYIDCVCV
jgi:hypothetical protein